MKKLPGILAVTGFTVIVAIIFLLPFIYGLVTSVKTQLQIANVDAPFIPSTQKLFTYDGKEYEVFLLKTDEGKKEVALIQKRREKSTLLDINAPNAQPFEWQGKWQTLEKVWVTNIKWQNYNTAYSSINFLRLLANTVTYAVLSTLGAVCSAAMVSYGFARFKFPYRDAIFVVVMATIILPPGGDIDSAIRVLLQNWVGWNVAAGHHSGVFLEWMEHLLAAPVLHGHSARDG